MQDAAIAAAPCAGALRFWRPLDRRRRYGRNAHGRGAGSQLLFGRVGAKAEVGVNVRVGAGHGFDALRSAKAPRTAESARSKAYTIRSMRSSCTLLNAMRNTPVSSGVERVVLAA